VEFSVPTRSQLRLYSEPHEIDVDFHLLQGITSVASATAGAAEEEEIAAILQPGVTYKLIVQFFNSHATPYRCLVLYIKSCGCWVLICLF